MLYKIIHNEVDINPQSYLKKARKNYTIGSSIPVLNLQSHYRLFQIQLLSANSMHLELLTKQYGRIRSVSGSVQNSGFQFRSEIFFRTTQELKYFLSRLARNFVPEFNIRLYDKNSESDFFSLHQNQNIFFSNIGNKNIFLEKKP